MSFESETPTRIPYVGFGILNEQGECLLDGNNRYQASPQYPLPVTRGTLECHLGPVPLMTGSYAVSVYLGDAPGHDSHVIDHALQFEVVERDLWGTGQVPDARGAIMWWPTTFRFLE